MSNTRLFSRLVYNDANEKTKKHKIAFVAIDVSESHVQKQCGENMMIM